MHYIFFLYFPEFSKPRIFPPDRPTENRDLREGKRRGGGAGGNSDPKRGSAIGANFFLPLLSSFHPTPPLHRTQYYTHSLKTETSPVLQQYGYCSTTTRTDAVAGNWKKKKGGREEFIPLGGVGCRERGGGELVCVLCWVVFVLDSFFLSRLGCCWIWSHRAQMTQTYWGGGPLLPRGGFFLCPRVVAHLISNESLGKCFRELLVSY